jgi:hypothetical protein
MMDLRNLAPAVMLRHVCVCLQFLYGQDTDSLVSTYLFASTASFLPLHTASASASDSKKLASIHLLHQTSIRVSLSDKKFKAVFFDRLPLRAYTQQILACFPCPTRFYFDHLRGRIQRFHLPIT